MELSDIKRHNSDVLKHLKKGDLVEFDRGIYSHWGVYIGDDQIVHLSGDDNDGINGQFDLTHLFTISGVQFNKAKAVKSNFWEVTGKFKAKKNNDKDKKYTPLSPEKIMEKALSMLGKIGYNVLYNNCEHFASYCRYNIKCSEQADNVREFMNAFADGVRSEISTRLEKMGKKTE